MFADEPDVVAHTLTAFSNGSASRIERQNQGVATLIENLQEGMRLPAKYRVLMEQISAIRNLSQKYFAAISEIQVVPKEYGNYELVLYPTQAKVRVLTDRSLTEDALKYMMVVLDVVNSIEPDVVEVDLRYDSLSYRCR